ncbi:hexokinase family protein [Sporothrix brasiliensis 5110]|uniref:Phosphotransferase n=1 Tax=Sporothrix brasiliensis 5110 TaxID=1398154 RepID=A0A0C2ER89_9PEZI|nr:hexokinase family protein [Sporothrix brasiliensis 5110]KIH88899.1 hexokinase family protein [Sporothrix brasiliensis 5110]
MTSDMAQPSPGLEAFLQRIRVDEELVYKLSCEFSSTFTHLAAESMDQFLPTPITESILLPFSRNRKNQGRGGTNLRVGFVELLGGSEPLTNGTGKLNDLSADAAQTENQPTLQRQAQPLSCLRRLHERSWPIQEHLKSENADSLFAWIGHCIADVVQEGCVSFDLPRETTLPMGVTFSFPMEQESLSEAKLMAMGKGFTISSRLDLGSHLVAGYDKARAASVGFPLPPITVAAIANDSVSTLVSFVYEVPTLASQKAAMGIICGTGSNATLLLKRSKLHPSKRPRIANVLPGDVHAANGDDDTKIAVNTEWSINGSAAPMRAVKLINKWDEELSDSVEFPGFQPLEYMTAGRYLGELGRIMLVDYLTRILHVDEETIPRKLLKKFEPHNTTFLSHYQPGRKRSLLALLEAEFPTDDVKAGGTSNGLTNGHCNGQPNGSQTEQHKDARSVPEPFQWTEEMAVALYHIAKAIETRAAAIIAAAIVGLLDCADELPTPAQHPATGDASALNLVEHKFELVVGYTGGCITNFQDYLADCQDFLDRLVAMRYGNAASSPIRVVLSPCHDGGIKGAGILVPASLASQGLIQT